MDFFDALGERAIKFGRYRDAHSALKSSNNLDKKVNELLNQAIQILNSKSVTDEESSTTSFEESIAKAVDLIYDAVKLKNPFGNQFQKLGNLLHYQDAESMRKYAKYLEQTLFKEIIEFGIKYLLDDKNIYNKVSSSLSSGKMRREFLKQLAIRFSGGKKNYQAFVENYFQAVKKLNKAKTETDFQEVQKTLLGRGTGDNKYYQYMQELSLEHPVSALLVTTKITEGNEPYIAPTILKSGKSLLDFLQLT